MLRYLATIEVTFRSDTDEEHVRGIAEILVNQACKQYEVLAAEATLTDAEVFYNYARNGETV